jgi:benzoyl-CoA-dihydrodiol lyase
VAFRPGYKLKLNSYDLGVDIELHDALQRLRFEHPGVRAVVVTSARDRVFCSGANIFMLGLSSHAWKVNFCKFTNETRNGIEDASRHSGLKFVAALNGTTAGGGYELALACDEILLVDDRSSAVSLPEVPLLGVLPGTGGLTRLTDKRRVRRDHADVFCTLVEGVRAPRAKEWRLVDDHAKPQQFGELVRERAQALAATSSRPAHRARRGAAAARTHDRRARLPLPDRRRPLRSRGAQRHDHGQRARARRARDLDAIVARGAAWWPLAMARDLDDAILMLRTNELELGTWILKTQGDAARVLACDAALAKHADHGFVRETIGMLRRTLARLDVTSRSLYALVEPGSCFAGTLAELALAADRVYMLASPDDPARAPALTLDAANFGRYPMPNGRARLAARFYDEAAPLAAARAAIGEALAAERALELGLVTAAPDELDWERGASNRARRARKPLARRADRPRGEPALRPGRDDRDARVRPPFRMAELDLHPPERDRRGRCAQGVRHRDQAALRPRARLTRDR